MLPSAHRRAHEFVVEVVEAALDPGGAAQDETRHEAGGRVAAAAQQRWKPGLEGRRYPVADVVRALHVRWGRRPESIEACDGRVSGT